MVQGPPPSYRPPAPPQAPAPDPRYAPHHEAPHGAFPGYPDVYRYGYGHPFGPPAPSDSKAVLSLVLGILSLFTCALTAIPAVILGFSAKSDIRRAGGLSSGSGLATGGIIAGLFAMAMAMVTVGLVVLGIVAGARTSAHSPSATRHPAHAAPAAPALTARPPAASATIGSIRLASLDPDANETFREQLSDEIARAHAAKGVVLVMTDAKWCSVCREFEASLSDARMQRALANVTIVRVDVDDFDAELKSGGMLETTLPWFYKVDASLRPLDAISAGEWDDNVPENMAPVLKSFVAGTLRARRNPSPMGTAL